MYVCFVVQEFHRLLFLCPLTTWKIERRISRVCGKVVLNRWRDKERAEMGKRATTLAGCSEVALEKNAEEAGKG